MIPQLSSPPTRLSRYALVRTVSQVVLRVERGNADPFRVIQQQILGWVARKAGRPLPKEAWDGKTFELDDVGAQRVAAAALDTPRYWSARVDDADRHIAQRTWTTEIGLALDDKRNVIFGCRLMVSSRGENPPFQPSIPVFVRDVVHGGNVSLDGRLIGRQPWLVATEDDVSELYRLMISPERKTDICVFSLPEHDTNPANAAASSGHVHDRTLGAAHIVVLTGPASYMLTDFVTKEFSVFNRAVRTYRPGFNSDIDDPLRHPLAMPHRIVSWPHEDGIEGTEAFERFLVRTAISQTVSQGGLEQRLPPFAEVRRAVTKVTLEHAREAGASKDDLLALYDEDNTKLRTALEEEKQTHAGLLQDAEQERDEYQRRFQEAKGESHSLRQRIQLLEHHLRARPEAARETPIPSTLEDLKEWADKHLSGSVVLLGRALRGAKDSVYEDPQLVYRALLLLRDYYVPMKRSGGDDLRRAYDEKLRALGLEDEGSISSTRLGEQGDDYVVPHNGKKRELDRHLKKGNSREPRMCFRIYFFWDDESEEAVVGWLPSHLTTRQS